MRRVYELNLDSGPTLVFDPVRYPNYFIGYDLAPIQSTASDIPPPLPLPVCLTYDLHPIIPDAIWIGNFAMRCMKMEPRL